MKWLRFIFHSLRIRWLSCASSEQRAIYFRKHGVTIGVNCRIDTVAFSTEPFLIEIGDNVAISSGTEFITHDGSVRCFRGEVDGGVFGRIKVGSNVFIGRSCMILLNTVIGDNCIVGAGSVVRGRFPSNSVIAGNPAKVVLDMAMQKSLFQHSPGLVRTNNLSAEEARQLVRRHFAGESGFCSKPGV